MTLENIVAAIAEKFTDRNVTIRNINKNGKDKQAICVEKDNIGMLMYVDDLNLDDDNIIEEITNLIAKKSTPPVDVKKLLNDKTYVRNHLNIGLQAKSTTNYVKKPVPQFEGLEQYLYVDLGIGIAKISDDTLGVLGCDIETAWNIAYENLIEDSNIVDIAELIGIPDFGTMYVASNASTYYGASAILITELLKGFADSHGVKKLLILPSSIHECIIIPFKNFTQEDVEIYKNMVKEINATEVAEEDRLIDTAYVIEF